MRQIYDVNPKRLYKATRIKHFSSDGKTTLCGIPNIPAPPQLPPALTESALQCNCNRCAEGLAKIVSAA